MSKGKKMIVKRGAASFYVVAFATLILMIIATSFATIIIAEITRTSNDDLAQSAYDSALAGVEDAKLAFYNYKKCISQGAVGVKPSSMTQSSDLGSCESIVWFMENGFENMEGYNSCDMVSMMLGRPNPTNHLNGDNEVGTFIEESSISGNNMMQSYTCTKIITSLRDYRATLSPSQQMKTIKVKFDDVAADRIKSMKLSWSQGLDENDYRYSNFDGDAVTYPTKTTSAYANPPTVYLGMIQTGPQFNLGDFDVTRDGKTNRGMLYFTPTNDKEAAQKSGQDSYFSGYNDETGNYVNKNGFLKSNDKTVKNKPYLVYCPNKNPEGNDYACSVKIEIPEPIGGKRNDDTFVFVFGLPYGNPPTDFTMEFYCGTDDTCKPKDIHDSDEEEDQDDVDKNVAYLDSVQVKIDSTGRANDLYRRVEARLEDSDGFSLSIMGPLELLGGDSDDEKEFKKMDNVITEYNFTGN